jgi:GNAT superfamily N-acetyltransferase
MADIFADTSPQYFKGEGSSGVTRYTGDEDTDKYLNSLPLEKRADALKRLTAPLSGEELAEKAKDPNYTMDRGQYGKFLEWKKTEETGILDDIGLLAEGGMHIFEQIAKTAGSIKDHPLESMAKLGPSTIEAFYQGTRNMYGMLAQSSDPTSKFFRFKAAIMGENSDEGYNQYLQARDFNRDSIELAEGKKTLLLNKDSIDHEMTQAMSYVADPSLIIPFAKIGGIGLRAIGMGEKAAVLAARAGHIKNMIIGGTLKYAVGKPIEFLGGATRGVIDYGISTGALATEAVTGMSAAEIAATVRMGSLGTTAASLAGHSAPIISDVSNAYIAGGAAQGLGQALGAIGNQMQRGPRGFVSYAKAALEADKAILSPHASRLLKLINGVDPFLSLTADIAKGSSHGMLIGAGLGYGNAGSEGFWQGAGAGLALGGVGGLAGSFVARASGAKTIERADITAKYAIEGAKQLGKIHQAQSWEFLRKIGEMTGTKPMMDGIVAAFDGLAPDARFVFRNDKQHLKWLDENGYDRKTGRHITDPSKPDVLSGRAFMNMDGVVMETGRDGQHTLHINTTKLMDGAKGGFRPKTVPHEMLHLILRKSVLTPQFIEGLKHDILGVRNSAGKLLEGGSVDPKELQSFFREYIKRTYNEVDKTVDPTGHANEAKRLSDVVDRAIAEYEQTGSIKLTEAVVGGRPVLEHLIEEFGAYYFQELVGAKSPDYLYFAGKYEGIRGVFDRTVNRFVDHFENKRSSLDPLFSFGENKSIASGFRDKSGKRVRIGSIDYMISDFLKMTQNQNRTGRVDLSMMSDKARGELILRKGLDDLGRTRGARDPRRKSLSDDLQLGKAIHAELLAIDPARQTDGAGNLIGHLTDTDLAGLVRAGHISSAMAQKIKTLQGLANNPDKVVFETGYWGESHTTQTGPNVPRVYGDEVPFTQRQGLLLGVDVKINKNGKVSMVARTLDLRVNKERAGNMWANPAVRDLWNGDRDMFNADYIKYLSNMGKDVAGGKIESSKLLDNGDGKGGQRRDVMHQVAGVPLGSGDVYVNHPIGEVYHDALNAYTMLSIGRMQDVRLTGEGMVGFDPKNAIPDIGKNFSPSDMAYKEAPNGKHWEHKSGYKFHQVTGGKTVAYDRRGETIGSYDSPEQAMLAGRQKLQAQQKAMHQVAQDVKSAYDKGVHFSPREEHIVTRQNEEYYAKGYHLRLRADFLDKIGRLQQMLEEGSSRPDTDPRHLRGIESRLALAKEIIGKIDRKENLFNKEAIDMLNEAGLPSKTDDIADGGAGQMWMNAQINKQGYAKDWDKMYPMTFRSALNDRLQQIIKTKPNITAQQLRKQLLQYGSRTGERLWAEAEAIGFVDWLESKIEPTYVLTRRKDANGVLLPRGEEHQPILKQKGVRDSAPLDPNEIADFLKNNGLSITIDTGGKSVNVGNTEHFTFGGTKAGYNETPIRINEARYQHGVTGHYGGDTIVHTRKTIRFDSEGNKYIYIEEVQSNNAEGKPLQMRIYNERELAVAQRDAARLRTEVSLLDRLRAEQGDYDSASHTLERLETYHHHDVADALASQRVKEWQSPNRPPDVSPWEGKHKSIRKVAKETEAFILANPDVIFSHLVNQKQLVNGRLPDDFVLFRTRRTPTQLVDMFGNPNPDINITFGEFKQLLKENPDIFTRLAEERVTKKVWGNDSAIKIQVGDKLIDFNQEFYPDTAIRGSKSRLSQEMLNTFQDISGSIKETLLDTYTRPEWGAGNRRQIKSNYGEYRASKLGDRISGDVQFNGTLFEESGWRFHDAVNRTFVEGNPTEFRAIYESRQKVKQGLRDYVWSTLTPEQKLHEFHGKKENVPLNENRILRLEDIETLRADLADLETNLQKDALLKRKGVQQQPLQELYDRARISLLELAAFSIREGSDNLVLTHPDDAPTVSMMKYDARTGFYGKALPDVWSGIIRKYGMEVKNYDSTERFLNGIDVANIPEIKQGFKTLSDASSETFAKCKTLLDMYETGVAARVTNENVTFITQTTSRPIHEVTTPRSGQPDFEGQVKQTINSLSKRVKDGEVPAGFLDAYIKAIEAKRAESKAFESMVQGIMDEQAKAVRGNPMGRDEIITAMALSRGKHIVMNDKFKADVMSGKLMTTFSVADGGMEKNAGGRTYNTASDTFRKAFIGKYFTENQETLPKGMNLSLRPLYSGSDIDKGFTITLHQGTTASGRPNQVGYINVNITGDQAMVSSTGVADSMRGNKLNNVLMSELAERVRSMGVKYLDGVIIDPENRPYHARMRTIGNADTIAGTYYDTTRSTLDPTAHYSVNDGDKGGRTYDTKSLKWKKGFIGRYANENPEMTKEIKLSFQTEKASQKGSPIMAGRLDAKTTENHYLQITEAGKEVGHITWKTTKGKDGRTMFADPSVSVEPQYRGKNFQHLLYSEAAERARAMGNTDFFQRIENDLGLPLKSQVKTFGENYSKLLDQYTGQYMPATMENFNKLKYPEMEIHMTESDGTVNIEKHKGHELWVYAWSKVKSDAWYAISEQDALVLRKSEDMPWFKKAIDATNGFVRYATAEDLNEIRGLHAISHGPDTLSGTDINTVGGERILEGAGGLPYPMLQAERGSPAAWASQGTGFVDIVNSAVKANKDDIRINRREAIMPLVFTTYEKARASVQGSEAYYKMFEIFKRGKIVSERDLRLAMLDAVEKIDRKKKTVRDDKGKAIIDEVTGKPQKEVVIENRQTDALRKIVSDNKMNWDEMLASVMLTLDDGQVQNFGTRAPMADDFMGAVWDRVMKGLSDKKKQEVMRFFPEWDASNTKNEFTLANFKMTMGKTISDSLTKGLKSGDVYAVFKFTDFVEPMKSGHRTYDTGIVQKNGQKPELLLLKKPVNVMDLHDIAISEESGQRPISSIPEDTRTNVLGMNNIPYGRTITKGAGQVDFRDIMANMSVAENFKEKTTPTGKVIQAINGYIIMLQGDKFKVYNGQKVQVGIYASEQEAKKRVMRDNRR